MTGRLFALWLCVAPVALAQDAPSEPDTPVALAPAYTEDAVHASTAWLEAWGDKPRLVSLQTDAEGDDLEARLKILGEKIFSNREWKTYWQTQQTRTAELLTALGTDLPALREAMERWQDLAASKVANQDAFFAALEGERDALEERIEATLDLTSEEAGPLAPLPEDATAWERRSYRLEKLERDIAVQEGKKATVQAEARYIEQLLASEEILLSALERDVELAEQELEIAQQFAAVEVSFASWEEVVERTQGKAARIAEELDYGRVRERSRQIELGLMESSVEFRNERIAELQADYEQAASLASLGETLGNTMVEWLREELWRILAGLLAVYVGVQVGLRLLKRAVRYILERADDNPDVDDDGDQRRNTLAEVFTSVARLGIYVVGGLLALEQLGVSTGPLLGSVAILGLAISFGSQDLVRDLVKGFFILLENQYAVGDVEAARGTTGTVEKISIRSTWIRSYNGDLHAIPNGGIDKVSNLTRGWSRSIVDVGIAYGADIDLAREVMNQVGAELYADETWRAQLEEAPVFVGVTALGDSAVTVRMHVRVLPGQQWAVQRELYKRAKVAFDKAGVEIPFPQVVVHQAE